MPLFTFHLICIQLCVEKASRSIRFDFTIGEVVSSLRVLKEILAFRASNVLDGKSTSMYDVAGCPSDMSICTSVLFSVSHTGSRLILLVMGDGDSCSGVGGSKRFMMSSKFLLNIRIRLIFLFFTLEGLLWKGDLDISF